MRVRIATVLVCSSIDTAVLFDAAIDTSVIAAVRVYCAVDAAVDVINFVVAFFYCIDD